MHCIFWRHISTARKTLTIEKIFIRQGSDIADKGLKDFSVL
jgi:hypothetical protein